MDNYSITTLVACDSPAVLRPALRVLKSVGLYAPQEETLLTGLGSYIVRDGIKALVLVSTRNLVTLARTINIIRQDIRHKRLPIMVIADSFDTDEERGYCWDAGANYVAGLKEKEVELGLRVVNSIVV